MTRIDREVESRLSAAVEALLPNSLVIGEEKAAGDPSLLMHLGDEWVWIIDPIDGTANFVESRKPIAMMVALLHRGEPVLAWILDPLEDVLLTASRGEVLASRPTMTTASLSVRSPCGAAWTRYFDEGLRQTIERRFSAVGHVSPGCTQGKGTGSGAMTDLPEGMLEENMVLSNRDKSRHSDQRGLDSKTVQTEQYQDHSANRQVEPDQQETEGAGNTSKLSGPQTDTSGTDSSLRSQHKDD